MRHTTGWQGPCGVCHLQPGTQGCQVHVCRQEIASICNPAKGLLMLRELACPKQDIGFIGQPLLP